MVVTDMFARFEEAADRKASELVRGKPLRSVMTLLHLGNFVLSQNRGCGSVSNGSVRGAGVGRLGYLLPLLTQADIEFKGASAQDALFAFGNVQEQCNALNFLYGYAELCQVAPFVHRGLYRVEGDITGVKLTFHSTSFSAAEVKDILIGTLFQPFTIHFPGFARNWFDAQVNTLPTVELAGFLRILQELTEWFTIHAYDRSSLSDAAMRVAVGVSFDVFRRFSAACMAFGQFHMSMADAIARRAGQDSEYGSSNDALIELLEWLSPCYSIKYVRDNIAWLAGLDRADVDKLMAVYSTSGGPEERRGEGFFPPFVQSGDAYIFSSVTIRHMMSSRNVLYSFAKHDKVHFDNMISAHLEPQLTTQAIVFLRQMHDVEIRSNVKWDYGEIDILVYRASENTALVIEAKGAVAPEGARMVYHVQTRIEEGITQLRRFDALRATERDTIVARALGRSVQEVHCVKAVLAWASFGTEKVWSQFTDIAPLNIALLAELVRRDSARQLHNLLQDILDLVTEIVANAAPHWELCSQKIGELTFEHPRLKFDEDALVKYRTAQHCPFP